MKKVIKQKATKQKITLAVVFILIIGLSGVYFAIPSPEEAAENHESQERLVGNLVQENLVQENLVKLNFTSNGISSGYSFTIKIEDNEEDQPIWIYPGNRDIKLDQTTIRNILRDIVTLRAAATILEEVENPEDFGIGRLVITAYFCVSNFSVPNIESNQELNPIIIRLGSKTPDHSHIYAMVDGDPSLHLVNTQQAEPLFVNISDLLDRDIPFINTMQLYHIYLSQRDRTPIEFIFDGTHQEFIESTEQFGGTWLTMVSPFPGRRLNFANFQILALESFEGFRPGELVKILDIDELTGKPAPEDLAPFGLDNPLLDFIMTDGEGNSFHLLFGNNLFRDDHHGNVHHENAHHGNNHPGNAHPENNQIYMKHSDQNTVFLTDARFIEGLLNLNPLNFIDRFVTLINIEEVNRITIRSHTRGNFDIEINNSSVADNSATHHATHHAAHHATAVIAPTINGQIIPEQDFRLFYQQLISLSYDQEIALQEDPGEPVITITYYLLNNPNYPAVTIDIFAYNPHFYGIRPQPGPVQFVTSRLALDVLFDLISQIQNH